MAVAHRDGLAELPQWLNADAPLDLSFTKLSTIGSALQMPFGALMRSVVPEAREDDLIRYRTINKSGSRSEPESSRYDCYYAQSSGLGA